MSKKKQTPKGFILSTEIRYEYNFIKTYINMILDFRHVSPFGTVML